MLLPYIEGASLCMMCRDTAGYSRVQQGTAVEIFIQCMSFSGFLEKVVKTGKEGVITFYDKEK